MTYYVYHIAIEGSGLDEGYIGISVEPKERWSRHKSQNSDSNPILKRAIRKYSPSFRILSSFDSLEEALWQEFTLRPFDRMGWNLTKGGGMPPNMGGWNKGQETPNDVREKQSSARAGRFCGHNHPRAKPVNIYDYDTNQIVAENVVVSDWAPRNGYHQAHITATATGKLNKHKGVYARYVDSTENSGFT